jgi:porphobilinogen synthase
MKFANFHQYRINQAVRDKAAETILNPKDFIYPYFVVEGREIKKEINNLWNVYHFSIDMLLKDLELTIELGIDKILLFGVIGSHLKNETGSYAYNYANIVESAIRQIKQKYPNLIVITDVCLCSYTNHGHCGIIEDKKVNNDNTLPLLAEMAISHARGGADFVAPSAMMDGQVLAIREGLDKNGFSNTKILSYSAKFASSFYGPFRDAAGSAPSFGDRKAYQMDYRVNNQAIEEIRADINEGADWVMVKPAHSYLDIINKASILFDSVPIAAYHVSGEYMMIKSAAKQGYLDERNAMTETLFGIKRAGASYIITYYAREYLNGR